MNNMKVSLIVAVYKDVETLSLIIESLKEQTYNNFELIVAEDGNSEEMKDYLNNLNNLPFGLIHTTQEDIGVRKSKSQNNAIRASTGEYLIFIDGDCILYHNFVENHLLLSNKKGIVSGRRVNVGPKYSKMLREKSITSIWLEKNFIKEFLKIKADAKLEKHAEEGFYIKLNGFIHKMIQYFRKKDLSLLGCNMSFYKEAMLKINGFDEELGNSAFASDADLQWRFKGMGYHIISGRFLINQFHLFHKRNEQQYDRSMTEQIDKNMKQKKYICTHGVKSL